ncbi:unnamed protein product [Acanthosepion pharaonis]|uniref:DUF7041 domain-containing protein n=1 Tax=Acanthosepion pharaonis TaxID=158019 RepID=A0A812ATK9_ACAPH|nr:unnamed protein product [Sepia pharaonis]
MAAAVTPFPPFHEGNIKNWFLQMEAIFTVRRITDQKTKFGHVVAVLPPTIVDEVADFLEAVPEVEPTPVKRSDLTENGPLWLDCLPTTITQILAPMSENTPIDQLADAADRIFSQLDNQTMPVHSAEATRDHRSLEKTVEDLQRQDLRLKMANLFYTPPRHCPKVISIYRTSSRTAKFDLYVTTLLSGLLRRPTLGPYRVLKRADKYFQIQKGIHTDNVSIDRLKPAFIEKSSSHTTSQSTPQVQETPVSLDKPKYTSSGRKVTFPKKFETFYYY